MSKNRKLMHFIDDNDNVGSEMFLDKEFTE